MGGTRRSTGCGTCRQRKIKVSHPAEVIEHDAHNRYASVERRDPAVLHASMADGPVPATPDLSDS